MTSTAPPALPSEPLLCAVLHAVLPPGLLQEAPAGANHDPLTGWAASAGLSRPEHDRLGTIRRRPDRARFVLGRLLAREALGRVLDRDPREVRITARCPTCGREHGRPELADGPPGVHLSISHSGALVSTAVTRGAPVGVDVEALDGLADAGQPAGVLTASEQAWVHAAPVAEHSVRFLRLWTGKEALLKALGVGFAVPPDEVELTDSGAAWRITRWPAGAAAQPATVNRLEDRAGCIGSIAVLTDGPVTVREDAADALVLLARGMRAATLP